MIALPLGGIMEAASFDLGERQRVKILDLDFGLVGSEARTERAEQRDALNMLRALHCDLGGDPTSQICPDKDRVAQSELIEQIRPTPG